MNLKKLALSAGIALSLSACASFTGVESQENLSRLKTGMSESQVLSLLGTPDQVIQKSGQDRWIYEFRTEEKNGRNVYVLFEQGAVAKAGELDGRDIAASKDDQVSGSCTRWPRPDFVYNSLCRR